MKEKMMREPGITKAVEQLRKLEADLTAELQEALESATVSIHLRFGAAHAKRRDAILARVHPEARAIVLREVTPRTTGEDVPAMTAADIDEAIASADDLAVAFGEDDADADLAVASGMDIARVVSGRGEHSQPAIIQYHPDGTASDTSAIPDRLRNELTPDLLAILAALPDDDRRAAREALGPETDDDIGGFGTDPRDSAALLRLRQIIDDDFGWGSPEDEEAGDYEARLRQVARNELGALSAERMAHRETARLLAEARETVVIYETARADMMRERDEARKERNEARRERDAYRRAKEENDERFMTERDEARADRDREKARADMAEAKAKWALDSLTAKAEARGFGPYDGGGERGCAPLTGPELAALGFQPVGQHETARTLADVREEGRREGWRCGAEAMRDTLREQFAGIRLVLAADLPDYRPALSETGGDGG